MPRRATLIKKIRAENPNTICVESGDLAYPDPNTNQTGHLGIVVDALKAMGYTAVGVGPVDIQFGENYYKTLAAKGMPVVNIGVADSTGAKPFIIKNVGGVKVGIVSLGLMPNGAVEDLQTLKQRYLVYGEARAKSDVLIVLDQGNVVTDPWLAKITKRYGAPDIIVTGTKNMILVDPKMVGDTMIVPTGVQGNAIGRVDIEVDGASKKMTYKRMGVDEPIEPDAAVAAMIQRFNAPQILSVSSGNSNTPGGTPVQPMAQDSYYSYQLCKSCHASEFDQWRTTKHAMALVTLEKENKTFVECLPCHSEMYRRIKRTSTTPDGVSGVECMTCHSDVLPHGADFKPKHDFKATAEVCKTCHTPERSPRFVQKTYYDMVKHKKT